MYHMKDHDDISQGGMLNESPDLFDNGKFINNGDLELVCEIVG